MNETLKGVAHIGAELAAAKADLQREMERHRKTWRQLEQVTGLLKRAKLKLWTSPGDTLPDDITAALSQQAEPVCDWPTCECALDPDKCKVQSVEPAPAQDEQQPVAMQPDCDAVAVCGCRIVQSRKLGNVIVLCASHIAQTAPRCQCCGYLVTDSEHRGCLRVAAPQPEQSGLVEALTQLLCWAEKQVCTHEETHRGGAIWEICDSCGAKWADDEGGRPAFVWPKAISNASAAMSAKEA